MRGFKKYLIIEFKLFLREPEAFFFTLVFPILILVVFGSIYGNHPTEYFGGRGIVDISVPAFMAIIIGMSGLMNIPMVVATEREKGILRRLKATPIRPATILLGWILVYFIVTLFGGILLVIAGKIIYNLHFDGNLLYILFAFSLSTFSFLSLGFVIASVASTARMANITGSIIFFPMLFLSGATFPAQIMPEKVQRISNLFPLTYVVKLLQGFWFGTEWREQLIAILVLVGLLVFGVVISVMTFRWE